MDLFVTLFGPMLAFVYHCFDRIVIHGYLSSLSRPEQVVYFFRRVVGIPVVSKEALSERTGIYQKWVDGYARNHQIPIEWAEKKVRKEDYVLPHLRRMTKADAYGVYFIFRSKEQAFGSPCRNTPRRTRTTAFSPVRRVAIPTITSTYATRSLVRW